MKHIVWVKIILVLQISTPTMTQQIVPTTTPAPPVLATPTCPLGQYYTGTACATCPACSTGLYSMGCGGSSSGTCVTCI